MGKKFHYGAEASKKAAEKATKKGSRVDKFKMETDQVKLLVLGSTGEKKPAIVTTIIHEAWSRKKVNGNMKVELLGRCASPQAFDEVDPLAALGWKLKDKYADSKNSKKKDFWKECMPKKSHHINVLNLANPDDGPKVYTMPGSVAAVVLDEFVDCDASGDVKSICDFDEGRPLIIKVKEGKRGLITVRYGAKFSAKPAQLIEKGRIEEETIENLAENLIDLETLQPKYDEAEFEKYFETVVKRAAQIGIDLEEVGIDDDEEEEEELEEDEISNEDEEDDEDDSVDEDDEEDEEEEDEDDDDDGEEEDDELELDEEDVDDDDEEEEEEEVKPKKKVKKKIAKKKVEEPKKTIKKKIKRKVRR